MRIVVLMALWQRHRLASLAMDHVRRLGLEMLAIGSEGEVSRKLAEESGAHYIEAPNKPLGAKWNTGLAATRELDPDAVLVLGSDNFVTPSFIDVWERKLDAGWEYLGVRDGYMFQPSTLRLVHWNGYTNHRQGEPLGSGRCYARPLLDDACWKLWDSDLNVNLDGSVTRRLKQHEPLMKTVRLADIDACHLGVKTDVGIGSFERLVKNGAQERSTALLARWFGAELTGHLVNYARPG